MTRLPPRLPRLPTDHRNFRNPLVPGMTAPFSVAYGTYGTYAASASISASLKYFLARLLKIAKRMTCTGYYLMLIQWLIPRKPFYYSNGTVPDLPSELRVAHAK